jgi:signal transduction histidine kinase
MWHKLFNSLSPDSINLVPPPVQAEAYQKIRAYWKTHGWQLVLGEVILFVAANYRGVPHAWAYGVLAGIIVAAYLLGFVPNMPSLWLIGSSFLLLIHGMFVGGLSPVTSLTFLMPYTFAGMLLPDRKRVIVQTWCMGSFWVSLIYGVLPFLPQLSPPNYMLISYDILLAVFTFQTLRFLYHLTVEINSEYVANEIRGQSQQFLARVSHELRTPLNSVLGFAKLLRHGEFTESQERYLYQIIEEGEHLNRLVSDLLDSAHLSTGKLTLHRELVDVNRLCEAIAEEQRSTLPPSVTFNLECAPGLPTISVDSGRLRQAIGNLVSNAVKYTAQGEITLRTAQDGSLLLIDVKDTGVGIRDTQQHLVFVPFVQLDSRRIGVGLGLDIARQIVRLHGGDIHVVSAPGQGSTFTIALPLMPPN